jgi:hypothetical protein
MCLKIEISLQRLAKFSSNELKKLSNSLATHATSHTDVHTDRHDFHIKRSFIYFVKSAWYVK